MRLTSRNKMATDDRLSLCVSLLLSRRKSSGSFLKQCETKTSLKKKDYIGNENIPQAESRLRKFLFFILYIKSR